MECLSKLALNIARSLKAAVNTLMAGMILVCFSNPTRMPPTAHNGFRIPIPSAYVGFADMLAVRSADECYPCIMCDKALGDGRTNTLPATCDIN